VKAALDDLIVTQFARVGCKARADGAAHRADAFHAELQDVQVDVDVAQQVQHAEARMRYFVLVDPLLGAHVVVGVAAGRHRAPAPAAR
jgi:hypothetical protein